MRNLFLVLLVTMLGCSSPDPIEELEVIERNDSLEIIIDFLNKLEKEHTVENVTEYILILKKENKQLRVKLKDTEYELNIIQDSLKNTQDQLDAIVNSNSEYRLLPIEVPKED